MTLSEIESTLGVLVIRHPDLNEELLHTLLLSSGWEDKNIKEALSIFKNLDIIKVFEPSLPNTTPRSTPSITSSQHSTSSQVTTALGSSGAKILHPETSGITFYQSDGVEEGKLSVYPDVPSIHKNFQPIPMQKEVELVQEVTKKEIVQVQENKPVVIENVIPKIALPVAPKVIIDKVILTTTPLDVKISQPVVLVTKEPESLIIHDELLLKESEKQGEIPANLPLLPFESSPHIWSFAHYKDVFHSDHNHTEEIKKISVMPSDEVVPTANVPKKQLATDAVSEIYAEEDVSLEKVPMSKGDESLVFLAGVMLLAIILILGYMYSNGRL